ncbi:hypothetical protein GF357_03825 [Candidatus Dojkabacteria bacterium]|nr:hypothetical protein [Candidatus Dojkabacteria bacterium]
MARVKITKQVIVISLVVLSIVVGGGVGYLIWRVNQEQQLSEEDAAAAEWICGDGTCEEGCTKLGPVPSDDCCPDPNDPNCSTTAYKCDCSSPTPPGSGCTIPDGGNCCCESYDGCGTGCQFEGVSCGAGQIAMCQDFQGECVSFEPGQVCYDECVDAQSCPTDWSCPDSNPIKSGGPYTEPGQCEFGELEVALDGWCEACGNPMSCFGCCRADAPPPSRSCDDLIESNRQTGDNYYEADYVATWTGDTLEQTTWDFHCVNQDGANLEGVRITVSGGLSSTGTTGPEGNYSTTKTGSSSNRASIRFEYDFASNPSVTGFSCDIKATPKIDGESTPSSECEYTISLGTSPPPVISDLPLCVELRINNTPGITTETVGEYDPVTVSTIGSYPDGGPGMMELVYTVNGMEDEQGDIWAEYNDAGNCQRNFGDNCSATSEQVTFYDLVTNLMNLSGINMTRDQINAAGIIFFTRVYDQNSQYWCTSNPANVPAGYDDNDLGVMSTDWQEKCDGDSCLAYLELGDTPPYCGDGILGNTPGEQCEVGISVPPAQCEWGDLCNESTDCQCPVVPGEPYWRINKDAESYCIDDNTDDPEARIDYAITVTYYQNDSDEPVGYLDRVVDRPQNEVDYDWLVEDSIDPSFGDPSEENGNLVEIEWNLAEEGGSWPMFSDNQSKTFRYSIIIPDDEFGTYYNIATAYPRDDDEISDDASVFATCRRRDVPDTGLFDSVAAKIGLGLFLVFLGIIYKYYDGVEGGLHKFYENTLYWFTDEGRFRRIRIRFESDVEKSRRKRDRK